MTPAAAQRSGSVAWGGTSIKIENGKLIAMAGQVPKRGHAPREFSTINWAYHLHEYSYHLIFPLLACKILNDCTGVIERLIGVYSLCIDFTTIQNLL